MLLCPFCPALFFVSPEVEMCSFSGVCTLYQIFELILDIHALPSLLLLAGALYELLSEWFFCVPLIL